MKRGAARGVSLVRRVHAPRLAGLLLAFLCIAVVFVQTQPPYWLWGLLMLHGFVWPHVALRLGLSSRNPYRAVSTHLLVDIACTGIWIVGMQFNALATVLLLSMTSMNTVAVGGPRLFVIGLGCAAAGIGLGGVLLGWPVRLDSTPLEVYAALPMLLFYPLVVGYECFRLDRRLAQHKRELALLSVQDGLTGLFNRGHWDEMVSERFARAREGGPRPVLMLIDVDRFKQINDTHGHLAGDAALRHVAASLKASVRSQDVCARYGGDEFVVLVDDADESVTQGIVERLQARLDRRGEFPWMQEGLAVSVGACRHADTLLDSDAWSRCADAALYEAKAGGRRRFVFYDPACPPVSPQHEPASCAAGVVSSQRQPA